MKAKKMNLLAGALVTSLVLVGCAKKKDAKLQAPTPSAMASLKEKMKVKGGALDEMTGSLTRAEADGGFKVAASLAIGENLWPEGSGLSGDSINASATVKKENTAQKAEISGSAIDGADKVEVSIGCTKGCEGAIVYVVVTYDGDKKVEGGFGVDFKTAKTANKANGVAKIKKAK